MRDLGTNPRDRNIEKLRKSLRFLATFIRSNESNINELLQIKRRGWMSFLEKKGLVSRVEAGTRGGVIFVLTPSGLAMAESIGLDDEVESFHYPANARRMSQLNLRHDLVVQRIVIESLNTNKATNYYSGAAMFLFKTGVGAWIPDATLITKVGFTVGLEYERTPKYGEERLIKLWKICTELNKYNRPGEKINISVWFFGHKKIELMEYKRLLLEGLPCFSYDRDRWYKEKGTVRVAVPNAVQFFIQSRDAGALL